MARSSSSLSFVLGEEMNRYRVIIAELATGIVRRADAPEQRWLSGQRGGEESRLFEKEEEAMLFKDEVLRQFEELEIVVRPAGAAAGGLRFYTKDGRQVVETFRGA